jgi:hypothetical protein
MNQFQQVPGAPQDINPALFIQGVPQRPPYIPQIAGVRPTVAQATGDMFAHLIYFIQLYSNNDSAWKALFWTASPNTFNNPFFMEWLGRAMEIFEYKMAVKGVPPMNALPQTASETASMMAASMVATNPGLRQLLTPEQQVTHDGWAGFFGQLAGEVMTFINQISMQQQMQRGYGGNPAYATPGYPAGGYGLPNSGMGARGAGGAGQMYNQVSPNGYSQGGYQPPQQQPFMVPPMNQYNGGGGGYPPSNAPVSYGSPGMTAGNRNASGGGTWGSGGGRRDESVPREAAPPVQTTGLPVQFVQTPVQQKENPIIEEIIMDGRTIEVVDNKKREFARASELKLTPSTRGNYPVLFNPETQVCYVEQGASRVWQVVENKEPGVDYAEHETVGFFKPRSKLTLDYKHEYASGQEAFKNILLQKNIDARLEDFCARTNGVLEDANGNPITMDDPFFVEGSILAFGPLDTNRAFQRFLNQHDVPMDLASITATATMYYIDHEAFAGDVALKCAALMNTNRWSVLHERMRELFSMILEIDWNRLHDDITKGVNEYLRYQLGVSTKIDSFMDDILDLPAHLEKKFGAVFMDKFEAACGSVAKRYLTTVNGDTEEYLEHFGQDGDDTVFHCVKAIVECVTFIPVHSSSLKMDYVGDMGRIDREGEYADFYKAVEKIFDYMADQAAPYRNVKMITVDGEEILITKAEFGDSYLIRKGR